MTDHTVPELLPTLIQSHELITRLMLIANVHCPKFLEDRERDRVLSYLSYHICDQLSQIDWKLEEIE